MRHEDAICTDSMPLIDLVIELLQEADFPFHYLQFEWFLIYHPLRTKTVWTLKYNFISVLNILEALDFSDK